MESKPQSRLNVLLIAAAALFAIFAFVLALGTNTSQAAPAPPAHASGTPWWTPEGTRTPHPWASGTITPPPHPTGTITPCPPPVMVLRPRIQFGHARPGEDAQYRDVLLNHFMADTIVDLAGQSRGGWGITVDPTQVVASPGITNPIGITVSVPVSPTHRVDIERVRAVSEGAQPYTSTAYLITLTGRRSFTDLSPTDWADDSVQMLVDQNVLTGYADGSFRPNAFVTRAQFAKMLVTAAAWPLQTPPTPSFRDVPTTFWGYSYIETAVAHGVISGYPDGTFRPNAYLTRAQLTKMVAIALHWGRPCGPPPREYQDVASTDWFYDYANMASTAQVMSGYADNTFRPYGLATRGQVAKILALSLFSDPTN